MKWPQTFCVPVPGEPIPAVITPREEAQGHPRLWPPSHSEGLPGKPRGALGHFGARSVQVLGSHLTTTTPTTPAPKTQRTFTAWTVRCGLSLRSEAREGFTSASPSTAGVRLGQTVHSHGRGGEPRGIMGAPSYALRRSLLWRPRQMPLPARTGSSLGCSQPTRGLFDPTTPAQGWGQAAVARWRLRLLFQSLETKQHEEPLPPEQLLKLAAATAVLSPPCSLSPTRGWWSTAG